MQRFYSFSLFACVVVDSVGFASLRFSAESSRVESSFTFPYWPPLTSTCLYCLIQIQTNKHTHLTHTQPHLTASVHTGRPHYLFDLAFGSSLHRPPQAHSPLAMLDESMFEDIHEIAENSAYLKAVEEKDVRKHTTQRSTKHTCGAHTPCHSKLTVRGLWLTFLLPIPISPSSFVCSLSSLVVRFLWRCWSSCLLTRSCAG